MTKTKVSAAEATARAKEIVQGAMAGGDDDDDAKTKEATNKTKRKTLEKKPAWMRYYEREAEDTQSPFGQGFAQTYDYFEVDVMRNYVQDNDSFFDLVEQHPESCAMIFPDAQGNIQILHHLTAATHRRAIVVGVDGFGSTNEVRAANLSSFTDKIEFNFLDGGREVPQVNDFMEQEFEDLVVTPRKEGKTTLQDFLGDCPIGYMAHPLWVSLIYDQIGRKPASSDLRQSSNGSIHTSPTADPTPRSVLHSMITYAAWTLTILSPYHSYVPPASTTVEPPFWFRPFGHRQQVLALWSGDGPIHGTPLTRQDHVNGSVEIYFLFRLPPTPSSGMDPSHVNRYD